MRECWRGGDLRAFLDGELPPADMQAVKEHLAECHDCDARYDEIAGRAGLVSGLLESLGEMERIAPIRRPQPARHWRRWGGAGAAIAAGLAIATFWLSKPAEVPVARTPVVATSVDPPDREIRPVAPVVSEAAVK